MNNLKKTASALVLAAAAVFASPAYATDTYYPEYPETPAPVVNNNNRNTNNNHNNANANAAANAAAIAAQQQAQRQAQEQAQRQAQQQTANGGRGGDGGNATGGNATGGNATGGTSSSDANAAATGGSANATGGASNATGGQSNSGGNNFSNSNNFEAPKPMGNVASTTIIPAGNCGEGWAMNVSIPFFGAGGGKTTQSKFCLSQDAAKAAINAGLVAQDTGMVATGLAGLRNLHPEFDAAANTVVDNLMKPCAAQAAKISAIMLTQPGLQCEGKYVAGTEAFVQALQAPAPVVPAAPLRVEIVNVVPVSVQGDVSVKVDGVVRTKEERPAVRHTRPATPRPAAPVVAAPKDPCGCK
ncbi:MAG: hypothetical protein ACXW30_06715 [Micavibrio sp.]